MIGTPHAPAYRLGLADPRPLAPASMPARARFAGRSPMVARVAIEGAGAVGLAIALGLSRRGIRSVVSGEDRYGPGAHPDRLLLLPRSLESLHALGILEAVLRQGRMIPSLVFASDWVQGSAVRCSLRELRDTTARNYAVEITSDRLVRVLLDAVLGTGLVDVAGARSSLTDDLCGPARPAISVALDHDRTGGGIVVRTTEAPGRINADLDAAHGLVWKLHVMADGLAAPELMLAACRDEAGDSGEPLARLRRRLESPAAWPGLARRVATKVLRWSMAAGLERAVALHVSMLDRQRPNSALLFQDRSRVGWRLPDLRTEAGRLHDQVGMWGLLLVRPEEKDVLETAAMIGARLGIAVILLPPELERAGFGQCEALYVRPDHVIGLQAGGLQPLRLQDVEAALGLARTVRAR